MFSINNLNYVGEFGHNYLASCIERQVASFIDDPNIKISSFKIEPGLFEMVIVVNNIEISTTANMQKVLSIASMDMVFSPFNDSGQRVKLVMHGVAQSSVSSPSTYNEANKLVALQSLLMVQVPMEIHGLVFYDYSIHDVVIDSVNRKAMINIGNAYIDLTMISSDKFAVEIRGLSIGDDQAEDSFIIDSSFIIDLILDDSGRVVESKLSDVIWKDLMGGTALVSIDEKAISLHDIFFDGFEINGNIQYYYGKSFALNLQLRNLMVKKVLDLWPQYFSYHMRSWYQSNVKGGIFSKLNIDVHSEDSGEISGVIEALFKNVKMTVNANDQMIENAQGVITLNHDGIKISIQDGDFHNLKLRDNKVGVRVKDEVIIVTEVSGYASSAFKDFYTLLGSGVKLNMRGHVESYFNIGFVDGRLENRSIKSIVSNFESDNLLGFRRGNMDIIIDNDQITIVGNTYLGENKVLISATNLIEKEDFKFNIEGKFPIANLYPEMSFFKNDLEGVLEVNYAKDGSIGLIGDLSIDIDDVDLGYLHWERSGLHSLHLMVDANKCGKKVMLNKLLVSGKELLLKANGFLSDNGKSEVTFSDFNINGNHASLSYKYDNSGGVIAISGDSLALDLSSFSSNESTDNIVKLDLKYLKMLNNVVLHDVKAIFHPSYKSGDFKGQFTNGGSVSLLYNDMGLDLRTTDAGAVFSAIGLTNAINNGAMMLYVNKPVKTGEAANGVMFLEKFTMTNAPLFARILSFASLKDMVSVLNGRGINFERLNATFKYNDGSVHFDESWFEGDSLAVSFAGDLNLERQSYEFSGEVIPFYTINRIAAKLPLIGDILSGGLGKKGIFSIDYDISRHHGNNDINVNIISMFIPKVLKLFAQ